MTFKKLLFNFEIIFLIFLIQALLFKKAYSVPNAGSLLNFEEEIRKVNILPTQVPENKDLINGVNGLNGEPFHKWLLSTTTVPLLDFVYGLKVFNAIIKFL